MRAHDRGHVDPAMDVVAVRRVVVALCLPLCALTIAAESRAHGTLGDRPDAIASSALSLHWNIEPWLIACLATSAALYAIGVARLWRKAGAGHGVTSADAARFTLGWIVLFGALTSPIDALGVRLFSMHMVQHELLMSVAAPLLVLGRPLQAWTWALPSRWRRLVGRLVLGAWVQRPWKIIADPWSAWTLHALALWIWHMPVPFEAALISEHVHVLQHTSFLVSALLFWQSVAGRGARLRESVALLSLFTTMMHTGALGALLTFSARPWYPSYAEASATLGVNATEDQQLGGLIMWVPAGLVYLAVSLAIAARLLMRADYRAGAAGVSEH